MRDRLLALSIGCLISAGIVGGACLSNRSATSTAPTEVVGSTDAPGPQDPRFGEDAEREFSKRRASIMTEISAAGPSHAWAGEYYEGDGLGENVYLCLAPNAGFAFEW